MCFRVPHLLLCCTSISLLVRNWLKSVMFKDSYFFVFNYMGEKIAYGVYIHHLKKITNNKTTNTN